MALQQPRTTVPAKNRIVVARRTKGFGLGETAHRLLKERSESMRRASHMHLRFGAPLMQKTRVIEAFVAIGQPQKKTFHLPITIGCVTAELVGDGEAQQAKRQLMFGLDCENVAADRFCLFRFVERAVKL